MTKDTGYGTIREASALLALKNGDVLAGIASRKGQFHGAADPEAQTQLYLSSDAGRSWRTHGDPLLTKDIPVGMPWGIRWYEPQPGVLRAFHHGQGVRGEQLPNMPSGAHSQLDNPDRAWTLDHYKPEQLLTYQDSHDNGLTWGKPQISRMVGDWSELYRKPSWNHIYGFTQLRDGTLLTLFLRGFVGIYAPLGNKMTKQGSIGEGTWGTEIAQPYCTRSEDGGLTWQAPVAMDNAALYDGNVPDSPNGGWSETVFGDLPSGRIVALCRPYRSPYSWQTHSEDGGRTWRLDCYTSFSTSGGPQMIATDTGCLAVVGRQTGLGIHTSADGGVNWDNGTLLDHDCWFNGFMEKVEPDVALVFYFAPGRGDAEPCLPRLQRLRITKDGPVPADG